MRRAHGSRDQEAGRLSALSPLLCHASAGARADIRTIRELMGHNDIQTTMFQTHVLNRDPQGVSSPADLL